MLTGLNFFHNIFAKIEERKVLSMTQDEMQKALWFAAKSGDKERIRMLVVAGADVNMTDEDGRTALNIASQYGQADAYKTLLAAREMQELMKAGLSAEQTRTKVPGRADAA